MTTQQAVETRPVTARSRGPRLLVGVVATVVLVGAVVAWLMANGPVAADQAQIEITYSDDGTSYTGHREIVEGTATIEFSNDTDSNVTVGFYRYDTGSTALAGELEFLEEGARGVPAGLPVEGYSEIGLEGSDALAPGSHTWTVDLQPGSYIFDVGPPDFHTTGLWRAVVFEVVAE